MGLTCPKCEAAFPKSQNGVIPDSIASLLSMYRIVITGNRRDANLFCQSCDTSFIATQESYRKLIVTSYIAFVPALISALAGLFLPGNWSYVATICLLAGGPARVLILRILNTYTTQLEETDLKDVSRVSVLDI